jgi:MFS family permease
LPVLAGAELRRATLVGAALPVGLGSALFLGTLYLQRVLGYRPFATGLAYLALALPPIAASPLAARLATRYGRRRVAVAGLLAQMVGLGLLAGAPADASFGADVLPGFVLIGLGAPLAFVPTTGAAMAAGGNESGLSSGVFNTAQQLGNALALAALATLASARTSVLAAGGAGEADALTGGYHAGFLLAAAILLAATGSAFRLSDEDAAAAGSDAGSAKRRVERRPDAGGGGSA